MVLAGIPHSVIHVHREVNSTVTIITAKDVYHWHSGGIGVNPLRFPLGFSAYQHSGGNDVKLTKTLLAQSNLLQLFQSILLSSAIDHRVLQHLTIHRVVIDGRSVPAAGGVVPPY